MNSQSQLGLVLLNLSAWLRRQKLLRALYRQLPLRWRVGVNDALLDGVIADLRFPRTQAWSMAVDPCGVTGDAAEVRADAPGINLLGYLRGQFGLAESARAYARALIENGTPVALLDVALDVPHSMDDRSLEARIGDGVPYPVSLVFINPDYLEAALEHVDGVRKEGHYLIACWFWELPMIPAAWLPALEHVDEILVASEFIEQAMRCVTDKPIMRVPLPLGEMVDSGLQRADFGLESDKFIFLAMFDFNSSIARKNPQAVIDAFVAAFSSDRDDVRLLVKTSNGHRHQEQLHRLLRLAAADSRIIVRDEVLERGQVNALQRCCNAFVSLHRAEGFGLGIAECMAMGRPVIATAWSGNLEFMDKDNSMLVNYRLIPVGDAEYPHEQGDVWAEPDVEGAAVAMRALADDPQHAADLGRRAARSVQVHLSPHSAAQAIDARLHELSISFATSSSHTGITCHH